MELVLQNATLWTKSYLGRVRKSSSFQLPEDSPWSSANTLRACLVEPSIPQTLKAVLRVEKCQFLALVRVEKLGQRLEPSNPTLKLL